MPARKNYVDLDLENIRAKLNIHQLQYIANLWSDSKDALINKIKILYGKDTRLITQIAIIAENDNDLSREDVLRELWHFKNDCIKKKLITVKNPIQFIDVLKLQEKEIADRKKAEPKPGEIVVIEETIKKVEYKRRWITNLHVREYPITESTVQYVSKYVYDHIQNLKVIFNKKIPGGYNMHIQVKFNGKKDDSAIYSSAVFNQDVTLQTITAKLGTISNSHYDTEDYLLYLFQIKGLVNALSVTGGCLDKDCNTAYTSICLDEGKFHRLDAYNFKSTNNNCLIQCFNIAFGLKGNIVKPDLVRKQLGIEVGTKIHYKKAKDILEHYRNMPWDDKHKLNKTKGLMIINEKLEIIAEVDVQDPSNMVQLYLRNEHYLLYSHTNYMNCNHCGSRINVVNQKNHKCNASNVSFKQRKMNKKRDIVKVQNIKEKNKIDYNSVVFWDLETFQPKGDVSHVPYASGWYNNEYKVSYGKNCIDATIDDFVKYENKYITAYNGSSFDFYFLINKLTERGIRVSDIIYSNNKIMSLKFGKNNKVFDLYLFLMSALKKACDDYKTKIRKSEFDHTKIKTWEDTETHKNTVIPYLKNDVLALQELFILFNDLMYDTFKVNITNYVTLSHLGYDIWTSLLNSIVEIPNDIDKYDFISLSIYAGRCYPQQMEYTSKYVENNPPCHGEDMKKYYQRVFDSGDFIYNADVSSLYPASMSGTRLFNVEYPIGHSRWSTTPKAEYDAGKMGFYQIKFTPPTKIRIPILPRRKLHNGVNIGVSWSLEPGVGTYNSVDIKNAVDAGYKVEFFGKCLVYDQKGDLFSKYIKIFYDMKKKADLEGNDVQRLVAKLFLNALYGKTLQSAIFSTSQLINDVNDFNEFALKYNITDWCDLKGDGTKLLVTGTIKDGVDKTNKITKPRHLGSFVTAYSRMIMLYFMKQIDPTLESMIFTYTDTDSLHIYGADFKKLKALGLVKSKEDAELGLLTNDIKNEGLIFHEKNLAPKSYYYEYINDKGEMVDKNDCVIKMKGINKKYLCKLKFDLEAPDKVTVEGLKKKGKNLTKADVENGVTPFSIVNYEQVKTFYKSAYAPERFINGQWYALGSDILKK